MNWKLISKDSKNQPAEGVYSDWKEQIARECFHQCVYCSIHENPWGGIDHYHIDHFRPKSKDEFAHLENDICNLFYSCPVCNRFKKDDWPGDPDLDTTSYPDPSITDYASLFELDGSTHKIIGKYVAANYLIERLYLNRPQLIYERREVLLNEKYNKLTNQVKVLVNDSDDLEIAKKFIEIIISLTNHMHKRNKIRPYTIANIRKPKK